MPTFRPPRKGVSYSAALTAAYATASEDVVIVDTLELIHSTFLSASGQPASVRVVNSHHAITATLEGSAPIDAGLPVLFTPVSFSLRRPPESESGQVPELELRIGNASKLLAPYLELLKNSRDKVTAIWRPYVLSDLSSPHITPVLQLTLRDIAGSMTDLSARAGITDLTNRRYPPTEYLSSTFPWLVVR